jgi:hypothetical protein
MKTNGEMAAAGIGESKSKKMKTSWRGGGIAA